VSFEGVDRDAMDGARESVDLSHLDEQPSDPLLDEGAHVRCSPTDHRQPDRQRLGEGTSVRFDTARECERVRGQVQRGDC
jgi:hypothetical protein